MRERKLSKNFKLKKIKKERKRVREREGPNCYYRFGWRRAGTQNGDYCVRIFSLLEVFLIHMEEESLKQRVFFFFYIPPLVDFKNSKKQKRKFIIEL